MTSDTKSGLIAAISVRFDNLCTDVTGCAQCLRENPHSYNHISIVRQEHLAVGQLSRMREIGRQADAILRDWMEANE